MKRRGSAAFWTAGVGSALAAIIIGCGGSGGSDGQSAPSGNAAVRSSSLGSYQSLGAGVAFPFAGLVASAPSTSSIHNLALFSPRYRKYLVHPDGNSPLQLVSELNLYTDGGKPTSTGMVIHYFTDAAGTKSAGSMTLTSPTGSFNYTTYPVTIDLSVDVTAGNLPCHGSATIDFAGDTGTNKLKGTLTLSKNSEAVTVDMTLSPTLQVGGSMQVVENGTTIVGTNLNGVVTGDIALDFTLQPQGYAGTGKINLNTNSIALTFTNPTDASCSLDSSGNLLIKYPGGKSETVANPLSAVLLGTGGGGTSTSTTASGSTASGSTATAGATGSSAQFAAPVATEWNTYYAAQKVIFGSDKSGEIVGEDNGAPAFATSPTAASQLLKPTPSKGKAYAINTNHMIVGSIGIQGGLEAVVWTSPTATAIPLKVPTGTTDAEATGINDSGQIIGFAFSPSGGQDLYWSSYTATPTVITPGPSVNGARPSQIDNAGHLFGQSGSGFDYLWASITSTPTVVRSLNPDSNYEFVPSTFGFSSKGLAGASQVNSGEGVATFWPAPNYVPQKVPVTSSVVYSQIDGIDDLGDMIGSFTLTSDGKDHIAFWQQGKTQLDLTPQVKAAFPTVTNGHGIVMLNDGSAIVSGSDDSFNLIGFYYLKRK